MNADWRARYDAAAKEPHDFTTLSGLEVEAVYGPSGADDRMERIGWPGEYPFTRGIYASGYRGKLWTIRQFSGFATPEETNRRYLYLLQQGQTGLSVKRRFPPHPAR